MNLFVNVTDDEKAKEVERIESALKIVCRLCSKKKEKGRKPEKERLSGQV